MRRLIMTTTALAAAAALSACGGDDTAAPGSPTTTTPSTTSTSTGDPGAMQTGTPGSDGTWAGQLGPVDMPPGPYAPAPDALPKKVEGWEVSRGASRTSAVYLRTGDKGDTGGIVVDLHHEGQPNLKGSNDATIRGKVYCEPGGGSSRDRCAVPFDGGYLTLTPGEGVEDDVVYDLGNALYRAAEG